MIFTKKPEGFDNPINVVGCYMEHEDKFLILRRHPKQSHGNKWCEPAGKVDKGETIYQAMKRELMEETGLEIPESELKFHSPVYVVDNDRKLVYNVFFLSFDSMPEIKLNPYEHVEYRWVTPREAVQTENLIHDFVDTMKLFYKI